jgi:hypothetical protein
MPPDEISELFRILRENSRKPLAVEAVAEKYLSRTTHSYQISILHAKTALLFLLPDLPPTDYFAKAVRRLDDCLTEALEERGYRENILTQQESLLIGSSGLGQESFAHPYTPGAILLGDAEVETIRVARGLQYIVGGGLGTYWGERGIHWMRLSPIDERGVTLEDPLLVAEDGTILAARLIEGTPYRRAHPL